MRLYFSRLSMYASIIWSPDAVGTQPATTVLWRSVPSGVVLLVRLIRSRRGLGFGLSEGSVSGSEVGSEVSFDPDADVDAGLGVDADVDMGGGAVAF